MDLLRCVLSRQPLENLVKLKLSDKFYQFRRQIIAPEIEVIPEVSGLELFCLHGELVSDLPEIIETDIGKTLTIFFDRDDLYEVYDQRKTGDQPSELVAFRSSWIPIRIYGRSSFLCTYAAKRGKLQLLNWARKRGFPWGSQTFSAAVETADIELLKWLKAEDCPYSAATFAKAVILGNLQILQWLKEIGCPWNEHTFCVAVQIGKLEIMEWLEKEGCPMDHVDVINSAAVSGNLEVLKWVLARSSGKSKKLSDVCKFAAKSGNLAMLEWARSEGFHWDEWTCALAADGGHLALLQWVRSQGCPWDENTCASAAENGHFDLLKWARSQGCPLTAFVLNRAIFSGNLEILQWLREQNCPSDEHSCQYAAGYGNLKILQWMVENGFDYKKDECLTMAIEYGHLLIVKWICQNEPKHIAPFASSNSLIMRYYAYSLGYDYDY